MIEFTIPGQPVAKGRPKFSNRGKFITTYTPEKTVNYENLVKLMFQQTYPNFKPLESELHAKITAYFEIPKSTSKKNAERMNKGIINPTKKPDCDNIAKIILDALNNIAYKDDSQVIRLQVEKIYSETPRVNIEIFEF